MEAYAMDRHLPDCTVTKSPMGGRMPGVATIARATPSPFRRLRALILLGAGGILALLSQAEAPNEVISACLLRGPLAMFFFVPGADAHPELGSQTVPSDFR